MTSPGERSPGLVPMGRNILAYPANKENQMSWIDAQGREHKLITAEKDLVVEDPILGFDRQIVAGQPVPPDLEDAYEAALSKSSSRSSSSSSSGASSSSSSSGSSDEAPDLEKLTRAELDKLAAEAGVEKPEELPNKDAVAAAIRERS